MLKPRRGFSKCFGMYNTLLFEITARSAACLLLCKITLPMHAKKY